MRTIGGGLGIAALLLSCSGDVPATSARIVGGPGTIDGSFITPRGIAADARGVFYVVDKTGRIQKFDPDGRLQRVWSVPSTAPGRPTSLAVDPQGNVWVADTHSHRIMKYSPQGEPILQFGREGRGPGEFLYPVGIQIDSDGTIYVSEFGGNDRVQVFDPSGRRLRGWGGFGEGPDRFRRPQALAVGGGRVYVADSANHRVVLYDRAGGRLGEFGGYGSDPGRLKYPYGLALEPDGSIWVAEYGNHRVQRFGPDGSPLQILGGAGAEAGRMNAPWAVARDGLGRLLVADAGNHRVQIWDRTAEVARCR